MSMIMQYVRIQPEELRQLRTLLVADPDGAYDYVDEIADSDRWRSLDTDKAWAGLAFLLDRVGGSPVDVIHGGERLTEDEWGYAPPRLLPTGDVTAAAAFLAQTPFATLRRHFDPAAMTGIYPQIWRDDHALDYLAILYEEQRRFFARAAAMGDALIVYLS